jgi:hypothetical protein
MAPTTTSTWCPPSSAATMPFVRTGDATARPTLHVDNPLMNDPDVEILRALSGVRNTRTRRFHGTQFRGDLQDDAPVLLKASPDGVLIEQVAPGVPQPAADGEFTFTLPLLGTQAEIDAYREGARGDTRRAPWQGR